jgi:endo-1,4-beta-xylanase
MNSITRKMKNFIIISILLAIHLIIGVVEAQLNTNGSFESSTVDTVAGAEVEGWVIELGSSADAIFEIVDDTVWHGTRSLKITPETIGTNHWDIQVVADSIPVQQGETYRYSAWAKSSGSSRVNFTVGNYAYTEYGGVIRPSGPNVTTEWQEYTFTFTVNDAVEYIRAPLHFSLGENVGDSIYVDNLRIVNVADLLKPVIVEADAGDVGSEFSILQDDTINYVSIQTDAATNNPGSRARMISYEVTFPDTGTYDLFARLRVGANTYSDDSFFYGTGFGEKDSINDADWIMVNGLAAAGFSGTNDVVREAGGLGSNVWKWVNLSRNDYQSNGKLVFTIEDTLTRTFQIGGREDGLDIDKLAFGKSYLYYTVGNLDNREPGSTQPPGEVWEGPPLATNLPKFVGNVYSSPQIQNFEAYWNQVTPENASKWGSVEAIRDNMNWGGLDNAYNFAKDNGFPFHFHVLIWGSQQPAWIDTLNTQDQLEEITEWFQAVSNRYDAIDYLEVVNEPLPGHNPPDGTSGRANYKEALGGDGDTGWDWVLTAFRMAREIFPPETKLMLNDFNIINSTSNTTQYLALIRLLQTENLIDIIGVQGHAFTTTAPAATMKINLDALATTGLPIQITELDIDGLSDAVQLNDYQRIFPVLYEHPGVEGITLWGWRRGLWRDAQGAYLINQDGSERPALEWLRDYLADLALSVEDIVETPYEFHLDNNYPNPFNPSTQIPYSIPQRDYISLKVFNILGAEVATLFEGEQKPGKYLVRFDGSGLASGVYLYQLKASHYVETKKFLLLK